jgi:hypothetical protein
MRFLLSVVALVGLIAIGSCAFALDDDDEAVAAKEKAAKEKALADKKARNAGNAADPATKDANNVFGGDGKKSGKESPFDGKADPKNPATTPPAPKPDALPTAPNAADALCPLCKGVGLLANTPYKSYYKFEGQAPPKPDFVPPCKYCPKCMPGKDAAMVSEDMKERQERARAKHKGFEGDTGKPLVQFETPFVTVRSMLKAKDNTDVAIALEKCAGILQDNSKSMVLMSTRADTDDLILMSDEKTWHAYIDNTWAPNDGEGKALTKKLSGNESEHVGALHIIPPPSAPPASRAVFAWTGLLMRNATNMKAKPWLVEGFSGYCENATLGTNLNWRIAYEYNDKMSKQQLKTTWNDEVKAAAKLPKGLKSWPEIFGIDLVMMKKIEYQTC